MASIKTQCPNCGARYWVEGEFIGLTTECDVCHRDFAITPIAAQVSKAAKNDETKDNIADFQPVFSSSEDLAALIAAETPEITIPKLNLVLIRVEPGTFEQGSRNGYRLEKPVHSVRITRPFWISKNLINQSQFRTIMNTNPSYFQGDSLPVETVSWQAAHEFCARLTSLLQAAKLLEKHTHFRLPSEAEWEYACKSSPPDKPSAPNADPLDKCAWYDQNSQEQTHPVGLKQPNCRGICDMLGNVGEWCLDWLSPYTPDECIDPIGPPDGEQKVRRGGGWSSSAERCTPTDRIGVIPETRSGLIGFRIVLSS